MILDYEKKIFQVQRSIYTFMGTSVGWAKSEMGLINPRQGHLALRVSEMDEMTSLSCKGGGPTGL